MATVLTGAEIIELFEEIIDDSPSEIMSLFLMNAAKDAVESGFDWNFNRGLDVSQLTAAGDNYLSMKDLPADFLAPRKLYVDGDINPWNLIAFEDRYKYKDIYKRWYIDYMNQEFALCGGKESGKTIQLFYARHSPTITLASSPVWPAPFHAYLPFKMAEMYKTGIDGEEVNFRMGPEDERIAKEILKAFKMWDASIKVAQYNAKNEIRADLGSYPNVVGQDFIPKS